MRADAYEIVDESEGANLRLVLRVEGATVATARVSSDVVDDMVRLLGVTEESVRFELKSALERLHRHELEKVTIGHLRQVPTDSLTFYASYVFRDFDEITEGVVRYDLPNSVTGPESVPALVRNKLRYESHRLLTTGNANAEALQRALLR